MCKSEVQVLLGLLAAILKDVAVCYPSDTLEVERDLSRLSLVAQTRGLGVFLLDLPALGKHFDLCLSTGVYVPSNLPMSGTRWKGSPLPRIFSGLASRVFERESGRLVPAVDIGAVRFLRQLYYFAKGYRHDCSKERTTKAVLEFYETDRELWLPSLNWDEDHIELTERRKNQMVDRLYLCALPDPIPDGFGYRGSCSSYRRSYPGCPLKGAWLAHFLEYTQKGLDYVCTLLEPFVASAFEPRHGRGAVSDLPGHRSKYTMPGWSEKLARVFPYDVFAFSSVSQWADSLSDEHSLDEEADSELLCVPKSAKTPRLIASEPTSHMWCQQMLLQYFVRAFEQTFLKECITLEDQTPSRRLALRASQDGLLATIDLSAASDRISTWLIERVFRANESLLDALHATRTRRIRNGTRHCQNTVPEVYNLRKFSTMGSACTFPVQSYVFTVLSLITIMFLEGKKLTMANIKETSSKVRVYGDDIIVPTQHYEGVCWALELFGLKVNHAKSFAVGNFRESCGMDAFMGYDVTPAHLNSVPDEARPNTLISAVDAANNFHKGGYWHAADYIVSTLPRWVKNNLPVVAEGSGRFGLESYCGYDVSHLKKGWDANTQQEVVRVLRVNSKVTYHAQPGHLSLFQWFIDKPRPDVFWSAGRAKIPKEYISLRREPSRYYSP